eukprot:TRINITY_DN14879_c0_g1_i1.p1 TRINITY_DN14879_c0_g1~~TRINITY_DN14879_c0_g1_i1.p1  ORF type:complete len:170 (-),score=18.98 TRINITY_DN14879_c0_g1_i1:30-539(-)
MSKRQRTDDNDAASVGNTTVTTAPYSTSQPQAQAQAQAQQAQPHKRMRAQADPRQHNRYNNHQNGLHALPAEMWRLVLSKLSQPSEWTRAQLVCSLWNELVTGVHLQTVLWKRWAYTRWPILHLLPVSAPCVWKEVCQQRILRDRGNSLPLLHALQQLQTGQKNNIQAV